MRTGGGKAQRAVEKEGERILAAIPQQSVTVVLEESGSLWSTEDLARQLKDCRESSRDLCLLVGGPDGLSDACRARADHSWSLSRLTLPHMLVRIIVAEQLYRAWTVLAGHPYHRR